MKVNLEEEEEEKEEDEKEQDGEQVMEKEDCEEGERG